MTPDREYLNLIEDTPFTPVFILGLHRSGTSILYKMLNHTGRFNVVTAYHLLAYDTLLHNRVNHLEDKAGKELQQRFDNAGIGDRGIDQLKITPDFAEEYGFLLGGLNAPTGLSDSNLHIFTEMCRKIQYISGNTHLLLLKNPFDFTNFLYIRRHFPDARFIFIHRDPVAIVNSQLNAAHVVLNTRNPYTAMLSKKYKRAADGNVLIRLIKRIYSPRLPFGVMNTVRQNVLVTKHFFTNIGKLPKETAITILYDDLCTQPNKTIDRIMTFLQLEAKFDFSDLARPRNLKLLPEVERMEGYVRKKLAAYDEYRGRS